MFWRLFGTYGVLLVVAVIGLGTVLANRVERHEQGLIEDRLHAQAILIQEMIRTRDLDEAGLLACVASLRELLGARVTLLAADGRVLADSVRPAASLENHAHRPEIVAAREHGRGSDRRGGTLVPERFLYVAVRVPGGGPVAYVRVTESLEAVGRNLAGIRQTVWITALVTAGAALGLAYLLARRTVGPLQELTLAAEQLAAGGYGYRVYGVTEEEVGTLARSFNRMSARLAEQFTQLEADRQQLRAVLGGMVEGVVALDAEQRILFANERASELLEFATPAVAGRRFWEVVRHSALQHVVSRALTGTGPVEEEFSWEGASTRSLTVHVAQLPGSPSRGAVLVLHDTTELRRLERMRQDFVANVSHELKTPLAVITACVETLLDGAAEDPEHRGPFLARIAAQSDRLHVLIMDLLSLARIESGAESFTFDRVCVREAVLDCLDRHRARAQAKQQSLELATHTANGVGAEATVWADAEAVGEILDNLVDNAVKYTPAGGQIRIGWIQQDGDLSLSVTDTGIGIAERDLPRIFERFYRVDRARSRELGGTGLGLSIVKHLAQAMGGSVSASSTLGRGTTFFVRLPRAAPS